MYNNLADFFYWFFEERCHIERLFFKKRTSAKSELSIDFREFRNLIEERVNKIVQFEQSIPTFDHRKFKYLVTRLENGVPIGAYSIEDISDGRQTAIESIERIDNSVKQDTVNEHSLSVDLKEAFSGVQETPCTIAEIINAGWLYKCENIYKKIMDKIGQLDEDTESEFKYSLFRLDDILRNSIETSHLTSLLLTE